MSALQADEEAVMAKKSKVNNSNNNKKNIEDKVELFSQLAASARYSRTLLSRQLLSSGLYAGQDSVILALDANDGLSLSAIADQLGVRAPTMTKTINRLAAQGFVDKRGSETDARLSHVYLTAEGREAVKSVRKAIRKSQKVALQDLSAKEVKSLMKLLKKLEDNIAASLA
jgi:DNA-binding MarR family transcriptional regulator